MAKKTLQGIVVSDKMKKTVVVEVESMKEHPKYKRRFKIHKKYKAHDQNQEYHVGDKVVIEETKPISKDKNWIVKSKI
jgi:small subunit ribosomal protein S17